MGVNFHLISPCFFSHYYKRNFGDDQDLINKLEIPVIHLLTGYRESVVNCYITLHWKVCSKWVFLFEESIRLISFHTGILEKEFSRRSKSDQ